MSLPVRGAWIEITDARDVRTLMDGRSPCGERGLKLRHRERHAFADGSLPVRGAWIEIAPWWRHERRPLVAPRAGSVD